MNRKVLCVDDERNILEAYQRSLRKQYEIETTLGGEEALGLILSHGPFAVIVSDMRMPGMDGIQFLSRAKESAPDSVRIMLTGNADMQTAIEAVNEGNIFRFLTKPCSPEILAKALEAGIEQYRLVTAERELVEKTLRGSVQILTDVLSLVNPTAFGRAARVRRFVSQLAASMKVEESWQIEIAAMLSQVGCVTVPEDVLIKVYRGISLTADEWHMYQAHPQVGRDLIAHIPRLENVAEIIAYQEKLFDGTGLPHDERRGQDIPLGARILKLALDFDKLEASGISKGECLDEIRRRKNWYDPVVVSALRTVLANQIQFEVKTLRTNELEPGMILAEDVSSTRGLLLILKGQEVTTSLRMRLHNYAERGVIVDMVRVFAPVSIGEPSPNEAGICGGSHVPDRME
jgi:response regulator RpfG family c-di-GMP phosphodiesterase